MTATLSRGEQCARYLVPRPRLCSALDPAVQPQLEALNGRLFAFYNSEVAAHYFATAEDINVEWSPSFLGHWRLKDAVPVGSRVLDLGCGSAHTARHFADRQIIYTGVDWSAERIERNREAMPQHQFVASSLYDVSLPSDSFDAVVSFYTIEHLVWPHRLLDQMYRLVRPGGLVAVLCPPFRLKAYLKSFDYGLSARPFADKLRSFRLLDAALHLYQHRVFYPRYLRSHHPRGAAEHRFLISLDPICLNNTAWFPDADAVYLADTEEIGDYLAAKGAARVDELPENGYILMRRGERD